MKRHPEKSRDALMLNHRISNRLQRIARLIEKELEKAGADREDAQFSLLIWGPDRMQYVSTAERSTVKEAMKEMIAKWDTDDLGPVQKPLGGMEH